ncbi:MAG: hypothetical protein U5R06_09500 [candidate division KSB1 bacterium]|nr:hypothetical protein [candidate division KSB1 bacterium]
MSRIDPNDSGELIYYDDDGRIIWTYTASFQQFNSEHVYKDHYRIFTLYILVASSPSLCPRMQHGHSVSRQTTADKDKCM